MNDPASSGSAAIVPAPSSFPSPTGIPSVAPWDEHNSRWVSHVRPHDWTNPTPTGRYNLLVVGAGPAGLVTAIGSAGLGAKVAIVERHLLGGDCLNVGCVPSKALIRAGRAVAGATGAHAFGIDVNGNPRVDFGLVMERLRRIRADLSHHDSAARLRDLGIDVFIGEGRFTGSRTFAIGDATLDFKKACIATGARAVAPPIPGLDRVPYLTNETVFTLTELPKRLAIIGAGPIGCELAQAFARLGSEVYLVESLHGILPREDRDAAAVVAKAIAADGVSILCCGREIRITPQGESARLIVSSHGHGYDLVVGRVVVAAGRAPNVEDLSLESAGVAHDKKGIRVDDRLRTTNRHIFAAGDVASKFQFTHIADFMGRIVIGNALFLGRSRASALTVPWSTYTEPELAHVGRNASQLDDEGTDYRTFTLPMQEVDRASIDDEATGFVRVHSGRKGLILGATVVAAHAGDLIGELSLAMTNRIGLGAIAKTIHPYPTQAEAIRKVGDAYNRTRLTPRVSSLMRKWLGWRL